MKHNNQYTVGLDPHAVEAAKAFKAIHRKAVRKINESIKDYEARIHNLRASKRKHLALARRSIKNIIGGKD